MKSNNTNLYEGQDWIKQGLIFGLILYMVTILFSSILKDNFNVKMLLLEIPICLIGGLVYAYFMRRKMSKKGKM